MNMVRPERFELPTLWFEAKCSIQLSYGRAKQGTALPEHHKNTEENRIRQLARDNWFRRRRRRGEHRHRLNDVESRATQQLINHRFG
jgi:hypothetical protein